MCRTIGLVIVDGGHHGEGVEYDAARTKYIEREGFKVIRFWNNEVIENMDGVLERIVEGARATPLMPTPRPPPANGRGRR